MRTLTVHQLRAVIEVCEHYMKRWPNESNGETLKRATEKLQHNLRGRVLHERRKKRDVVFEEKL